MQIDSRYQPLDSRYDAMTYRRAGRSGVMLPAVSLGYWKNFGYGSSFETGRAVTRRAFDLGVTHFDLANNYGPPYGSAEENFGRFMNLDMRPFRDEMFISTKAGYDMWPGPYGNFGSRKYLTASLDQSLLRMGLDYVDVFYHHRMDPLTPLEETMGALKQAVRSGKALYVGLSNYDAPTLTRACSLLGDMDIHPLLHQPPYSMLDRRCEDHGVLDAAQACGMGTIVFSPLAGGLLSGKYNHAGAQGRFAAAAIEPEKLDRVSRLEAIATRRGCRLSALALLWVLRRGEVTSALVGASSVSQLEENVAALSQPPLTEAEIEEIEGILREE